MTQRSGIEELVRTRTETGHEAREALVAKALVTVHRNIRDFIPYMNVPHRKAVLEAFDYMKFERMQMVDLRKLRFKNTFPDAVKYMNRMIVKRLVETQGSVEEFRALRLACPPLFEHISAFKLSRMELKIGKRTSAVRK